MSLSDFMENTEKQDAVVRNLEIIGEAVRSVSPEFRRKHNNVEWGQIAGLRDKLIHHYGQVCLERSRVARRIYGQKRSRNVPRFQRRCTAPARSIRIVIITPRSRVASYRLARDVDACMLQELLLSAGPNQTQRSDDTIFAEPTVREVRNIAKRRRSMWDAAGMA